MSTPDISIIYVSPEMAERWLAKNVGNRPLKVSKIAQYARDMKARNWHATGEPIKFGSDGRLLDGQNRLSAVIESGETVPFIVIRGIEPEAQLYMDSGSPRTASDSLGLAGYPNAKDLAPSLVALKAWQEGVFKHCMFQSSPGYTKSELHEFADLHPDMPEVAQMMKAVQPDLQLPIGALAACGYVFKSIDADAMDEFYGRVRELRTSGKGDPIQTLIKRVAQERSIKRRIWVPTAIFFQVRAWNAWRDGDALTKFQIGSDASGWAEIPVPR